VTGTADLNEGFKGTNWALLVGSVPRKAGMERGDLLGINGKIFTGQGKAIARNAANDVRVLVVGNPCNTNCLIAMNNAEGVPKDRFFAMTRLDENRAKSQLAAKASVHVSKVTNMCIWGNHSATQYPDFTNAKIQGRPVTDVISHVEWLKGDFITTVQQRGAAIIKARGASSAASAANAAIDTVKSLITPTPKATGTRWPFAPTVPTASKKASSPPCPSAPSRTASGRSSKACPSTPSAKPRSTPPSTSSRKSAMR
jgi:malate dehydrogenase